MKKDNYQVNAALQLLPLVTDSDKLQIIDKAIALIKESGLNYKVCPFETVVEGTPEKVFALINAIRIQTLEAGCSEMLINIKIHAASRDLFFEEKLKKYPDQ